MRPPSHCRRETPYVVAVSSFANHRSGSRLIDTTSSGRYARLNPNCLEGRGGLSRPS